MGKKYCHSRVGSVSTHRYHASTINGLNRMNVLNCNCLIQQPKLLILYMYYAKVSVIKQHRMIVRISMMCVSVTNAIIICYLAIIEQSVLTSLPFSDLVSE